ncbi:hypothetical protein VCR3J2_250102 [Vibrio coralliirubri]|nr:hypothetical protein VCR3J2_250102 [Vibrio coralliirubri]
MASVYLAKCNVGRQEQKRDSLSRSFLTVGNDGVRAMMTLLLCNISVVVVVSNGLVRTKTFIVIPEPSGTRHQESGF